MQALLDESERDRRTGRGRQLKASPLLPVPAARATPPGGEVP